MTEDTRVLDHVQRLYQHLWSGGACGSCGLRERCPGPLDLLEQLSDEAVAPVAEASAPPAPAPPRRRSKRKRKPAAR